MSVHIEPLISFIAAPRVLGSMKATTIVTRGDYFRAKKQFSSGVVEGLNNKVKVTMRKSYGFRTFRITEIALYHVLGKLPEPELTHRFY
jgi:hypothetical protein